jgi:hypothetical protein
MEADFARDLRFLPMRKAMHTGRPVDNGIKRQYVFIMTRCFLQPPSFSGASTLFSLF